MQEAENEEETQWIGPHTFARNQGTTWQQSEEVEEHRRTANTTLQGQRLTAINTRFQKNDTKLVTWKAIGTRTGDPLCRAHYDQLDYILIPNRWKNGITNAESDMEANIDSDHFPVWAACCFNLKKPASRRGRPD